MYTIVGVSEIWSYVLNYQWICGFISICIWLWFLLFLVRLRIFSTKFFWLVFFLCPGILWLLEKGHGLKLHFLQQNAKSNKMCLVYYAWLWAHFVLQPQLWPRKIPWVPLHCSFWAVWALTLFLMGDSIWKHREKHEFFFLDFWPKKSKVFDILVIKTFFLTKFWLFLTTFRIF